MKVLVSWLRELVDVPVGIEALAERLHLAGFELASITPLDPVPGPDGPTTGPDAVIDFEITANRPDALSVAGFAREVAALYDVPLRFRPAALPSGAHPSAVGPLRVTIEDPALCPRFTAGLADVTVGPSPAWLAGRLTACGVRSINNIVDITNYVLLETGHPIHAYDLARLAQTELRARRAAPGRARPDARRRDPDGVGGHARHRRRGAHPGLRRHHGRRRLRGHERHDDHRRRERALHARPGAAHGAPARAGDGSVAPLRARRRLRRGGHRPRAGPGAGRADRRRDAASGLDRRAGRAAGAAPGR